jgi:adhesin transport system membrane fusion protein
MLRFSNNSVSADISRNSFKSFQRLGDTDRFSYRALLTAILVLLVVVMIFLFLPWTQHVRAKGELIALSPEQRPQKIQSVISGQIEKWYVQEGQFVEKGDTILLISEVKDDYFNPGLIDNTKDQIVAKRNALTGYLDKVSSLENQYSAILKEQSWKTAQLKNKVKQVALELMSDSIALDAEKGNYQIAVQQYERFKQLYENGLKSLTELENRRQKFLDTKSKMLSLENKWLAGKNELANSKMELQRIQAEYADKLSKIRAEIYSTLSLKYDGDFMVAKMENQLANYEVRSSHYIITAPQSGYVTKALQAGIGEVIKEGADILSIMPAKYDLAIEMYVRPIDIPLISKGQKVMIQFDGWPAIFFSGWPGISYGTYMGRVRAIDQFISSNNLYRVIVVPDEKAGKWPVDLRVGTGVQTISFLKDVQVWYEIWRRINGFPPDFYKAQMVEATKK